MNAATRNLYPYVLYKLGGLTVTVTDDTCAACGRGNLALRYVSKRRNGGEVVICHLCMKDISRYHREYMEARKPGST